MKNSFFLIIPEQREDAARLKMYDEIELTQWIDELPVTNESLSADLLSDFIKESNQLLMSPPKRMAFLEVIRSSYLRMEDSLYARLMVSGFPKSEQEYEVYHVLVSIQRELAIGYWAIVKEQTRRGLSWFQSKDPSLSIQRVIRCLSSIVVSQAVMNISTYEWVWIDLHSLYKLGVRINKETNKVTDESSINRSSSIQNSYQQIILLSLANASGLTPKEVVQVYRFSGRVCHLITLDEQTVPSIDRQCVIFQDEDQPATYYEQGQKTEGEVVLYLNFSKFYKAFRKRDKFKNQIEGRYSALELTLTAETLPLELLNYLDARWRGILLQGTRVFFDRLNRYFVIGLSAAYDLQNTSSPRREGEEKEHIAKSVSDTTLSCEFDKSGAISIGSLVSFRKQNHPEHRRSLGIINKVVMSKAGEEVQFEINLLTTQAHAVLFSEVPERADSIKQKALIYNIKKAGKEDRSFLVVDSFMLKEFSVLRLYLNDQNFPILLRKRRNIGLGYWQFDCRQVDERELARIISNGYDFP